MSEIKPAIPVHGGFRCPECAHTIRAPKSAALGIVICHRCDAEASITAEQVEFIRNFNAKAERMQDEVTARLSVVPRYPVCGCGGPLMLPEQAGKGAMIGRLFCGSCGAQTGVTQKATAEQIDKARAAAKAEGFEVKS